jgi:ribosomal protein S18 acetylase RimI-like enzyme
MQVRKFTAEDADAASAVMKAAFRSFLGDKWTETDDRYFAPEVIRQRAHRKDELSETVSYVAVEEGEIVGYIKGTASENGLGTLEVVGIRPSHFGKGVGTALMKALEEFWDAKGLRKVSTCVSAHNKAALLYYIKHGFIPEGYCRDHFREGVDEIMLGRFLKKDRQ